MKKEKEIKRKEIMVNNLQEHLEKLEQARDEIESEKVLQYLTKQTHRLIVLNIENEKYEIEEKIRELGDEIEELIEKLKD